ncbi:MAG: endolytic transglycosylase MltG, partial [Desulfobulbaceae bacterium]|nr:endolytic transglycosylase MltG [Desulfobulbaceae bacterium]
KQGFTGSPSLEGYLYPDTYYLSKADSDAEHLIAMQTRRFKEVWRTLNDDRLGPAARQRTVTLASLVEKETAVAAERPLVAGVFLNRLRLGMPLQSDPTVLYGVSDSPRPITRADLERATPYNTYIIAGLPAGPIANPGKESLAAALKPATTDFLYFVAKNDGSHQFSTTLGDHNAAVQRYQRQGK